MDASTRPLLSRRLRLGQILPSLTAALMFATAPCQARPNTLDETSALTPVSTPFASDDSTEISLVPPGNEGLTLSARFSGTGQALAKDVSWTIHNTAGALIYDDMATLAEVKLDPGTYVVDAHYGNARLEQAVNVADGVKLNVNLVLNAGALRLLPRLEGTLPAGIASISKVYALTGSEAGKLIATSRIPGEILKLAAGSYRIENSFERGNEIAITQIEVKPGILTAVDINHHAALVHLAYNKVSDAGVTWDIRSGTGEALPEFTGTDAQLVLKPGTYLASARSGLEVSFHSFTIVPGQSQDIIFGD